MSVPVVVSAVVASSTAPFARFDADARLIVTEPDVPPPDKLVPAVTFVISPELDVEPVPPVATLVSLP